MYQSCQDGGSRAGVVHARLGLVMLGGSSWGGSWLCGVASWWGSLGVFMVKWGGVGYGMVCWVMVVWVDHGGVRWSGS